MKHVLLKYALSLVAGVMLLGFIAGSAGAVTVSSTLPAVTQPALSNAIVTDESAAPKIENVWYYGYHYHYYYWHPHVYFHPYYYYHPHYYYYGWHHGFCFYHPHACGY